MSPIPFTISLSPPALPCPEAGRITLLRENKENFPEWPGSYFELGLISYNEYLKQDEGSRSLFLLDEATSYFTRAIECEELRERHRAAVNQHGVRKNGIRTKGYPDFHVARGIMLAQLGRLEEAKRDFDAAYKIDPEDFTVLSALASFYTDTENETKADELHRQIVSTFPKSVEAHVNYAFFLLVHRKKDEDALKHYTIAAKLAPTDYERRLDKGVLLRLLGRFGEAQQELLEAMDLYARSPNPDQRIKGDMFEEFELAKKCQS